MTATMPALGGWALDLLDAQMAVRCEGAQHNLRWSGGTIHLDGHEDAESEAILAALGGNVPDCLVVSRLWEDALADGGFLAEWSLREQPEQDRPQRIDVALARLAQEGVQDVLVELPPRRAARMGLVLARFPPDLQDRAALSVAEMVIARAHPATAELAPFLARAVRGRARSAFVASLANWREFARPAPLVRFECGVDVTGNRVPEVRGALDGRASWCHLQLDLRWMLDVWGPGLAVVSGHFVVAADPTASRWPRSAVAVRWSSEESATPQAALARAEIDSPGGHADPVLNWL